MDPLHFSIALGPLAVYLLLLGLINLSPRPFLTTGPRDTAALAIGIGGFVVAGPMELFLPEAAVARFGAGGFVWLMLLMLYALCVTLLVLLMRPRLVIYNITADQLRPVLAQVVTGLDSEARWAGESLVLPSLGVQLHLESAATLRNAQLVATAAPQNLVGWRRLEFELAKALYRTQSVPNLYGVVLIAMSVIAASSAMAWTLLDQPAVAEALSDMLRM